MDGPTLVSRLSIRPRIQRVAITWSSERESRAIEPERVDGIRDDPDTDGGRRRARHGEDVL
jgi:hypothetical protein